jgi:hypothetical protein
MELTGLERLMRTCQRLKFALRTLPPGQHPPAAGTLVMGHPLDPLLAAFYARLGQALFATDVTGMGLYRFDDIINELEYENNRWVRDWQEFFTLPLFAFGGETGLAYTYATVPSLADSQGVQPVVRVCRHEQPYALPIASSVDRFFDTYASYLEELAAHPLFEEDGGAALAFPWEIPHVLARDTRLVELLRTGRFEALLRTNEETRQWVESILQTASGG